MTATLPVETLQAINRARGAGVGTGVFGWSPGRGGVHHHRIREPLRVLAANGVNASHGIALSDQVLSEVDTILVHTLHDEYQSEAWEDLAAIGTHRLVYDMDDAMWCPDYPPFRRHYRPEVMRRIYRNVALAHVVTTPSPVIAEHLARHNPNVHVVANTVPEWVLSVDRPYHDRVIGWQMSDSHLADVRTADTAGVAMFLHRNPGWDAHSCGSLRFTPGAGIHPSRVHHTDWVSNVDDYYRTLPLSIGLGPLRDTPFNRGKSPLRAIEYAALGVVAVLPDMKLYRGWVHNGVTGVLLRRGYDASTLAGVLSDLARDPVALADMAANARHMARRWTTERNIDRWVDAWQTA